MTNIAVAEVDLTIDPINTAFVVQGGSIDYRVTITLTEPLSDESNWLDEVFSILDKRDGWTYNFVPENVRLLNNSGESRTSILTMTVPETAPVGLYQHTVLASGTTELDEFWGLVGGVERTYVVSTPVDPIPELNTGILTSIGIFGLLLLTRRNRKNLK